MENEKSKNMSAENIVAMNLFSIGFAVAATIYFGNASRIYDQTKLFSQLPDLQSTIESFKSINETNLALNVAAGIVASIFAIISFYRSYRETMKMGELANRVLKSEDEQSK